MRSNIGYWIDQRGYKRKYVAKELGISEVVLSRWINNHSIPSLKNAFRLAKFLGCKVDDLYSCE